MVPNGPFLEKWKMLILGSAVHHNGVAPLTATGACTIEGAACLPCDEIARKAIRPQLADSI